MIARSRWSILGLPGTLALATACASASSTPPATEASVADGRTLWVDAAGRANGRIAVSGTTIHYVDYGGHGQPIVLLAGLGNSAHIFDDFATQFTGAYRVIALTRRGFGESGRPSGGYDTHQLTDDVRAVLDSLGLARVVLVGHSVAGDELTDFAVRYPARTAAVVYLDAAYDRSRTIQRLVVLSAANQMPPTPPKPRGQDRSSVAAYRTYLAAIYGVAWPEPEVRATRVFDAQGKYVRDATSAGTNMKIVRGERGLEYGRITAPVLAIYAVDRGVERDFAWTRRMTVGRGAAELKARRWMQAQYNWEAGERERLAKALPKARIVEVEHASHFIFISHADLVEREIRAFLSGND